MFTIDVDFYERVVAVRKSIGLPSSDYLDRIKECLKENKKFVINGNEIKIKRGFILN